MKQAIAFLFSLFTIISASAQESKILSECTVVYDLTVEDSKGEPNSASALSGATKIVYIKGSHSRTDLISKAFQQTIITDTKSDTSVILRELGNTKYISYLNANRRNEQYKRFDGITIANTGETKTILGYNCKKAIATLKDGSVYNIYYAPSIVPSNNLFEYQFRDLDGFPLEYEAQTEDGKTRVKYSANKITLTPVPAAKFDIPKTGYRVL